MSDPARDEWSAADVVVRVLPLDGEPAAADRALAELVAAYLGVRVDQVHVGRRCPQCAATDHGRPVVRGVEGRRAPVSIARTLGRTAVAAGSTGPIGVDVENVDADRFSGVATVARQPGEPESESATLADVAVQWVRKEAVLKATGWGVTYGPDRVNVTPDRPSPFPVRAGSGRLEVQLWVTDLDVGSGYAAALAVVSPSPPRVLIVD